MKTAKEINQSIEMHIMDVTNRIETNRIFIQDFKITSSSFQDLLNIIHKDAIILEILTDYRSFINS